MFTEKMRRGRGWYWKSGLTKHKDRPEPEPPTEEHSEGPGLVAEQAIRASPGLADKMEAG